MGGYRGEDGIPAGDIDLYLSTKDNRKIIVRAIGHPRPRATVCILFLLL
jgi:hypothetical protein